MIALIRLRPPTGTCRGIVPLDHPPEPPGARYSGFFAGCADQGEVVRLLDWFEAIRAHRPDVPLALVCPPGPQALEAIAATAYPIDPILAVAAGPCPVLPADALDRLRDRCIEGTLLATWSERFGEVVHRDEALFRTLIDHGIRGDGVGSVAQSMAMSPRTVRRRVTFLTGLRAVTLLLDARVRGYELRLSHGVDKSTAAVAGGWFTSQAVRKARRRLEDATKPFGSL